MFAKFQQTVQTARKINREIKLNILNERKKKQPKWQQILGFNCKQQKSSAHETSGQYQNHSEQWCNPATILEASPGVTIRWETSDDLLIARKSCLKTHKKKNLHVRFAKNLEQVKIIERDNCWEPSIDQLTRRKSCLKTHKKKNLHFLTCQVSLERFLEVKDITNKLYSQLNVEEYQLKREKEIISQLEEYKLQIAPFVKAKSAIEDRIHSRNKQLMYLGSTLMGFQFGFFALLTWFEYSWDVMEPVTYFATYAAVIGMYAYFAVTAQEYNYVDAWDREFLNKFYKVAEKEGFNIPEYNRLTNLIDQCKSDLRRLRDPLQIHIPIREL
ncbi:calcium uniporter protein, mitochondrial-like [Mya arenaria]|uniref:calcium uniporter protein, mitochondrial-like n=1 Tax=Mya arenaria TaxID=6604 RepID=UPI0022E2509C|nr:calcium uniporter protein, mitochondrial-like [Mya arenaria]